LTIRQKQRRKRKWLGSAGVVDGEDGDEVGVGAQEDVVEGADGVGVVVVDSELLRG